MKFKRCHRRWRMNRYHRYQNVNSYWYDEVPDHWKKTKNKYVFHQDKKVLVLLEDYVLLTMGKFGVKPREWMVVESFSKFWELSSCNTKSNNLLFIRYRRDTQNSWKIFRSRDDYICLCFFNLYWNDLQFGPTFIRWSMTIGAPPILHRTEKGGSIRNIHGNWSIFSTYRRTKTDL